MKKVLIGIASIILFASCFQNVEELKKENRIFKTNGKYFVYYNGSTFELPNDLYLTKNKKVEQYFSSGLFNIFSNKSDLLNDLNKYFPDGINYVTENENIKPNIEIPLITVGNEKHIDSIKFEKIIEQLKKGEVVQNNTATTTTNNTENNQNTVKTEVNLNGKKIEILNANGIAGFAKNIGDKLKTTFGLEFNAENYNKPETMNYVITRKLNENEVLGILKNAGLKHVRIKEDATIKPDADFVLITGNDQTVPFRIEIATLGDSSVVTDKLSGYKTEIVKSVTFAEQPIDKMEDIQVVYNKADIYTAKLIESQLLSLGKKVKLVESDKMNGRIVVVSKN